MKHLNLKTATIIFVCIICFSLFTACEKVKEVSEVQKMVKSMTLEQKAQLVIGTGMLIELPEEMTKFMPDSVLSKMPSGFNGIVKSKDTNYVKMVEKLWTYLPGTAGVTAEFPSLNITSQVLTDGPAGLRIKPIRKSTDQTFYCTAFPIATVLASTWDTQLVYNVGKAMGEEVKEYGSDILLAPALNIQRDPLCGRNFEYYSEDPLLTGKMAAAMVNGVQSNEVGTSIKHFAANNSETNRLSVNTIVSERALREIYLKGFEIAVKESQPWTVMSSYNKINGTYASESEDLLTKILRDDWGFKGYVMTDWGGGSDLVAQMNAGNDMIQPGTPQQVEQLVELVKSGKLDEKILDRNVERILNIMLKTPRFNNHPISNKPNLEAHASITRKAATDGMVLLKNNNKALPISKEVKNVATFGVTSLDIIAGGTGSGDVNEAYIISLFDGLINGGLTPDSELAEIYTKHIETERAKNLKSGNFLTDFMGGTVPVAEMSVSKEIAAKMANKNDIALITIGRNSGEGGDRKAESGDFYLNENEKEMIQNVSEAFHKNGKKVIVILNIGGVIETASWNNLPDAILCAWQPGQEAGNSIVDILKGDVNPSGKLAVSFPMSYDDTPTAKNFPGQEVKLVGEEDDKPDQSGFSFMKRVPWEIVYEEGIYVGYRYYNTFGIPVAYEFGYGLSYSTFEFSNLHLNSNKFEDNLQIYVDVKNTGDIAGREVVQIYISAPQGQLGKPAEELVAFAKTKSLQPGESERITFKIAAMDFASFNEKNSSWVVESGEYILKVGASSKDIRDKNTFTVSEDLNLETVSKALIPQQKINELKK